MRTDEDELCAIYLRNRLEGRPGNAAAVREVILAGGDVLRFHGPSRPDLNQRDVEIALDVLPIRLRDQDDDGGWSAGGAPGELVLWPFTLRSATRWRYSSVPRTKSMKPRSVFGMSQRFG